MKAIQNYPESERGVWRGRRARPGRGQMASATLRSKGARNRPAWQVRAEAGPAPRPNGIRFPAKPAERRGSNASAATSECLASVTVLTAEVVVLSSTDGSSPLPARSMLLDRVSCLFERLADLHGIRLIEMAGKRYVAAAGLRDTRADHADAIAEMALGLQREIGELRAGGVPFSLRIGVHSGPSVASAGQGGSTLSGPAVDIAGQMESCGIAGGIQVSSETYELLEDRFLFETRGEFYVNGEGDVTTYLLRGRRR